MTPEERIQQLAAARGGQPTYPRARLPASPREPTTPTRPNGFGITLPASWRNGDDSWKHKRPRDQIAQLELWLAAGVIVRYLGPGWRKEWGEENYRQWVRIIHRDGYGFDFRRDWSDGLRFRSSPLETYRRDDPPAITTSAARTLGSIARDIENRLINNGLREAYEQETARRAGDQEERRQKYHAMQAVARAWGGRMLERRRCRSDGYPEVQIPGGVARYYYDGRITLELTVDLETALELAPRP